MPIRGAAQGRHLLAVVVASMALGSSAPAGAGCSFGRGLACFPVFSSCAFTAGFAGRDPYLQCVDTLSSHWCTECVTDSSGLDPRAVVCPNGGGLAAKVTDCPGYATKYLSAQMAFAGRAVAPNQDGRLEIALTDASGRTSHLWQEAPAGDWTASAAPFPGSARTSSFPAIVRHTDGRLDVFVVTAAGSVAHSAQVRPNVNWGPWTDVGGALRPGGIAASIDSSGGAVVVALGRDGAVWFNHQAPDDSFAGWHSLGGSCVGTPVVGQNADGRLEIFAISAEGGLLHSWQAQGSDAFGPWVSMGGGAFVGSPSVARNLDQRLEVFASTKTGVLAHAWQTAPNGGWSGFEQTPGTHLHDPAVAMNTDGTLDVFVVGVADKAVWHRRQVAPNSGWGEWKSLGGSVFSTPAVGRNSDGTLEVLGVGQDGAIWHSRQTSPAGSIWTPWARLGGRWQPDLL